MARPPSSQEPSTATYPNDDSTSASSSIPIPISHPTYPPSTLPQPPILPPFPPSNPPQALPPFPPRTGFQPVFHPTTYSGPPTRAWSSDPLDHGDSYRPPHMREGSPAAGPSQHREYHSSSRREPSRSPQPFVVPLPPADYVEISREPITPVADAISPVVPKLLILDLNGALVFRKSSTSGAARRSNPRPYLQCFLDYVFLPDPHAKSTGGASEESTPPVRSWEVFVWSSAQPHNVRGMVEGAFGKDYVQGVWDDEVEEEKEKRIARGEGRLLGVWARDKMGLSPADYNRKVQTVKDLRKIRDHLEDPRFDERTIVLLDDSPLKAVHQPWSQLVISEYDKKEHLDSKHAVGRLDAGEEEDPERPLDKTLLAIIGVLEALRHVENVPAWIRSGNLHRAAFEVTPDEITLDSLPSHESFAHWYKIPGVFKYWTEQGELALKRKNIEVRHGIVPTETGDALGPVDGARSPKPYRSRNWSPSRPSLDTPDEWERGVSPMRLMSPPPDERPTPEWWNRPAEYNNGYDNDAYPARTGTSQFDFDYLASFLGDLAHRPELDRNQARSFRGASKAMREVHKMLRSMPQLLDHLPQPQDGGEIEIDDDVVALDHPPILNGNGAIVDTSNNDSGPSRRPLPTQKQSKKQAKKAAKKKEAAAQKKEGKGKKGKKGGNKENEVTAVKQDSGPSAPSGPQQTKKKGKKAKAKPKPRTRAQVAREEARQAKRDAKRGEAGRTGPAGASGASGEDVKPVIKVEAD